METGPTVQGSHRENSGVDLVPRDDEGDQEIMVNDEKLVLALTLANRSGDQRDESSSLLLAIGQDLLEVA